LRHLLAPSSAAAWFPVRARLLPVRRFTGYTYLPADK
jgi:hypothetical protein